MKATTAMKAMASKSMKAMKTTTAMKAMAAKLSMKAMKATTAMKAMPAKSMKATQAMKMKKPAKTTTQTTMREPTQTTIQTTTSRPDETTTTSRADETTSEVPSWIVTPFRLPNGRVEVCLLEGRRCIVSEEVPLECSIGGLLERMADPGCDEEHTYTPIGIAVCVCAEKAEEGR